MPLLRSSTHNSPRRFVSLDFFIKLNSRTYSGEVLSYSFISTKYLSISSSEPSITGLYVPLTTGAIVSNQSAILFGFVMFFMVIK